MLQLHTHLDFPIEFVDRMMYVESPSDGTFAVNNNRYFVLDACGVMPLNEPLCHDQIGVICDGSDAPDRSSTMTNGFDTRNSTTSSRCRGSEL